MLAVYVHQIDPFLIHFPDGWGLPGIRWYGVCYILGFLAAWGLLKLYEYHQRVDLDEHQRSSLMTATMIGVLLGGRLGYCLFYDTQRFLTQPWILFEMSQGGIAGMSSHGGFLGVGIAVIWVAYRHQKNLLALADVVATVAPPGLFFGRIANFINGELWGKLTNQAWGVIFPQSAGLSAYPYWLPRHPSQLYEALLEGLVLGLYLQWRFWYTRPKPGMILAEFFIFYSLFRIFSELFREPDASLIFGLSRGTFYSCITLGFGLGFWLYVQKRQPKPQ